MLRKVSIILLFLLSNQFAFASDRNTSNTWNGIFNKKELVDGYSWWSEANLRHNLDKPENAQTLIRTGLLKKISDSQEVGLLYAFVKTGRSKEHRITLQHAKNYGSVGDFKVSHRGRLEVRSMESQSTLAERLRYSLRFEKQSNSGFTPVFWEEIFINLRRELGTGNRIFERNRVFIGFRVRKIHDLDLEIGYLNQFIPRHDLNVTEHILALYLFI
ncbi:MAG: DUF2490 domain-containing protein [Alphaproteobacteria bacterium]|nr:DUF2490 domain-containing protein [Alphaproteobacteria bacterium]